MDFFKINKFIGVDVRQFLIDFIDFIDSYFPHVVAYYQGNELRNQDIFSELDRLKLLAINILTGFQTHSTIFNNLQDWEILESVEDANVKINTMIKVSKYLRSSILTSAYNNGIQNKDYTLKQSQYLEGVSWAESKSDDPNNDWVDIAVDNDLNEEAYTPEGLINLKLNYTKQGTVNDVKTVVDNITGENILGKDIFQLLTFHEVEGDLLNDATDDLLILGHQETVLQSANILLNLSKNDNPEFWMDGIPSNLTGNSGTAFAYPIFFRELANVFSKDDTIKSFQVNSLEIKSDLLFMELNIETILGEMIKGELSL